MKVAALFSAGIFSAAMLRPGVRLWAGIFASAALAFLYARGGIGWLLGFVVLVPWLRTLDANRTMLGALLRGWAMSVAFIAAAFAWFGIAIGSYSQLGTAAGVAVLLIAAPLLQPQFIAFALVRHAARRWHGPIICALAGAAAWVATEWLLPKFLGDTLGYGLYPSALLRQAADVGGTAGLTFLLLLANEGISAAAGRRANGARAVLKPLLLAALVPALLAGYGFSALSVKGAVASPATSSATSAAPAAAAAKPLRMGLMQSNIIEYDRLRREKGAEVVIREVLDTHFAMTYDAVEKQHADAVLWSETVYPLTFGHPKSEAGAELDREIQSIVNAAKVPFVFGTYDVDADGEYNATAFVEPDKGVLGFYRKTRLFPFTEYVPAWLDGPLLRQLLPWTGAWKPGTGARVFPLRLKDGREIPVLPMICLDDVDTSLAIDGARLGGQAILTMSNDSWFTGDPLGAEMHQTAAAFRSIETRMPQFRVTSNGFSAIIDKTGAVIAGSRMGERTLVIGELPVGEPPLTLMVAWGDWVGRVAAAFLVLLALTVALRQSAKPSEEESLVSADAAALPANVAVLPPAARFVAGLLRSFSRCALLGMAVAFVFGVLPANTFAQIRIFTALFLVPELAAFLVLRAFAARASFEQGALVLTRGKRRLELLLADIVAVEPWRLLLPAAGASLQLDSGQRYGLAHAHPAALARVLGADGATKAGHSPTRAGLYAHTLAAIQRGRLDHPVVKFVLFPLVLAIPAFRLYQVITFGGSFGEYEAFGLTAYLLAFALWWAAWAIGAVVTASALRAAIEAGTLGTVLLRPARATEARHLLERLGLVAFYLGMPAWLLMRVFGT